MYNFQLKELVLFRNLLAMRNVAYQKDGGVMASLTALEVPMKSDVLRDGALRLGNLSAIVESVLILSIGVMGMMIVEMDLMKEIVVSCQFPIIDLC